MCVLKPNRQQIFSSRQVKGQYSSSYFIPEALRDTSAILPQVLITGTVTHYKVVEMTLAFVRARAVTISYGIALSLLRHQR